MEGKTPPLFSKLKNGSMLCFRVFTEPIWLKTCLYILYLSALQTMAEEK